jgi:hypothetical protein
MYIYMYSMIRWEGYTARMEEIGKPYKILVGKPEGKRPLGRPWHRWNDNIRLDIREIV